MIRFDRSEPPNHFETEVRKPGRAWLKEHSTGKCPSHWMNCRAALADAFNDLCAYSAMYEPVGTVDHFVSQDENRDLAYEWSNFRYCAGWMNSSKSNLRSTMILDPFEVGDEWFRIILPSLQFFLNEDAVPSAYLERAKFVLSRLHLVDDERVIRQRRSWYQLYQQEHISLRGLRLKAPLIAAAVERGDTES